MKPDEIKTLYLEFISKFPGRPKLCEIWFVEEPGIGSVERKWEGGGASEGSWLPKAVVGNDAFAIWDSTFA